MGEEIEKFQNQDVINTVILATHNRDQDRNKILDQIIENPFTEMFSVLTSPLFLDYIDEFGYTPLKKRRKSQEQSEENKENFQDQN